MISIYSVTSFALSLVNDHEVVILVHDSVDGVARSCISPALVSIRQHDQLCYCSKSCSSITLRCAIF